MINEEINKLLMWLVELFKHKLGDNLVGVYLHGSLAMGCFNPEMSDVDLLVVVKDNIDFKTKRAIIEEIINPQDSEQISNQNLEFSLVLHSAITDFKFDTPFELHYSNEHNERYKTYSNYICGDDTDKDLAAHFTITYHRGITLFGEPIKKVFKLPSESDYIKSLLYDIEDIEKSIHKNPIYGILSLSRIYYYLKEKVINSKKEGGEWAVKNLPDPFNKTAETALKIYLGDQEESEFSSKDLNAFADFVKCKINEVL